VKRWFNVVEEMVFEHQHQKEHIFNMDKSGFAGGASQSSRALVNTREKSSWKQIGG